MRPPAGGRARSDQTGLFEQLDDLGPCHPIEKILADRAAVANRFAEPAPGIGTETTIVIDRAGARSRRCPVERVAAVGTGHQALHHTGHDRTARCVRFVGFQTLPGEGEGLLIDDRRYWNRDPLVLRPLMVCTVTRCNTASQAQRPGDGPCSSSPRCSCSPPDRFRMVWRGRCTDPAAPFIRPKCMCRRARKSVTIGGIATATVSRWVIAPLFCLIIDGRSAPSSEAC